MTKLLFLGTGAADWNMKDDLKNPDFRGLSSLLIDDHIMVDCSIGAFLYADRFGISDIFRNVDSLFITHSHDDHFDPECIKRLCRESEKEITVYGDKAIGKLLPQCDGLKFVPMDARYYDSVKCGNYCVTALKSNHATLDPEEQTHHYYFEGEKNLFIGFDGGWLITQTWDFLMKHPIDVYVIDSTCGDDFKYNFRNFSHNNSHMIDLIYDTCIENKVMTKDSQLIMTHIAKTLHPSNAETAQKAAKKGYIAAFDGFVYEF